jgi:uncharacterized membrane protein
MTSGNPDDGEPTLFSAILTPYRSLGGTGFLVLMSLMCGVSFAAGLFFFLLGAWPIVGFLGLDVLLVYAAFRANYRAAAAYESVTMTPSALTVRRVSQRGEVAEWTLNPVWVRLDREVHEEFGLPWAAPADRGLPGAPRKGGVCAGILGGAHAGAARSDPDG